MEDKKEEGEEEEREGMKEGWLIELRELLFAGEALNDLGKRS